MELAGDEGRMDRDLEHRAYISLESFFLRNTPYETRFRFRDVPLYRPLLSLSRRIVHVFTTHIQHRSLQSQAYLSQITMHESTLR